MPKIIETTVYTFDELHAAAKEKARDWWREGGLDHNWYEPVYTDAAVIGLQLKEFEIDSASFIRNVIGEIITSAPQVAETIKEQHGDSCQTYIHAQKYLYALENIAESPAGDGDSAERGIYEQERQELDDNFLTGLLSCYKDILQQELEHIQSDEHIDETIRANEYTFTIDGKRFG